MWLVWRFPMCTEGLKLGPVVLYHLNPPHSPPSPAQNQFRQDFFEGIRWHLKPLRWIGNLSLPGGSTCTSNPGRLGQLLRARVHWWADTPEGDREQGTSHNLNRVRICARRAVVRFAFLHRFQ